MSSQIKAIIFLSATLATGCASESKIIKSIDASLQNISDEEIAYHSAQGKNYTTSYPFPENFKELLSKEDKKDRPDSLQSALE